MEFVRTGWELWVFFLEDVLCSLDIWLVVMMRISEDLELLHCVTNQLSRQSRLLDLHKINSNNSNEGFDWIMRSLKYLKLHNDLL